MFCKNTKVAEKFEKNLLIGLKKCNVNFEDIKSKNKCIGAAVSGGADSLSLLISLANILSDKNIPLKIITVNHNIRKAEETCGDVDFVKKICSGLKANGFDVECFVEDIPRNVITEYADKNKTGIEDAARSFRYECFEKFVLENNVEYLCLAHNKNDQLETAVMRFLQGSDATCIATIPFVRDFYIRPLLNISRDEIESYLQSYDISWRTDSTNFDTNYLRNKIRQKLVPFLDENFEGWQNSVISGIEKSEDNRELLLDCVEKIKFYDENNEIYILRTDFDSSPRTIKIQLILKGMNLAGVSQRIPYNFLNDVVNAFESSKNKWESEKGFVEIKTVGKCFSDVKILYKKDVVLFEKCKKNNTDLYFFDIIEQEGSYDFPFGKVEVIFEKKDDEKNLYCIKINGDKINHSFLLPVCIKNMQLNEEIKNASGGFRKIADIYSDWHVTKEMKSIIPIISEIEDNQFVNTCIFGSIFGYKNWIVQ